MVDRQKARDQVSILSLRLKDGESIEQAEGRLRKQLARTYPSGWEMLDYSGNRDRYDTAYHLAIEQANANGAVSATVHSATNGILRIEHKASALILMTNEVHYRMVRLALVDKDAVDRAVNAISSEPTDKPLN